MKSCHTFHLLAMHMAYHGRLPHCKPSCLSHSLLHICVTCVLQIKLYNFNNPGWSSATGHFTQVVWRTTTRLGCAYNPNCSWRTYVCQYAPPGNIIGTDWSANVPRVQSTTVVPAPAPSPRPPSPAPRPPSPAPRPPSPSPRPVTPTPTPVTPPAPTGFDTGRVLRLQNWYRAAHGTPALVWDNALQASAQRWANTCQAAASRTAGVGELIAFGNNNITDVINMWYSQVRAMGVCTCLCVGVLAGSAGAGLPRQHAS